jgi:hypothetical protein
LPVPLLSPKLSLHLLACHRCRHCWHQSLPSLQPTLSSSPLTPHCFRLPSCLRWYQRLSRHCYLQHLL